MAEFLDYLVEAVVLLATARFLYGAVRQLLWPRLSSRARASSSASSGNKTSGAMVRDPVCGTFVSTELSHRLKWQGATLHFCSEECLNQYRRQHAAS